MKNCTFKSTVNGVSKVLPFGAEVPHDYSTVVSGNFVVEVELGMDAEQPQAVAEFVYFREKL